MGLRHVVCFRFHPDTPSEAVDALAAGLRALPATIAEIDAYLVGPDLGIADTSWDFAVSADFADAGAFATYRSHPEHLAVIRDLVEPICAERVAVQFAIP